MTEQNYYFQAIGIIEADISFEKNKATLTIEGKEYPLNYADNKWSAFHALRVHIEATGQAHKRLLVYPKFTHYPDRNQPYRVSFQLVGFDGQKVEPASAELNNLEFKLAGLWQFIPVCRTPCISVFKNFTDERLAEIKQLNPSEKAQQMKASHIPLMWRDALVPAFRFNPKAEKEEQGYPHFVTLKAKFNPAKNLFYFEALTALPQEKPPKFLKASKDDKQAAAQANLEKKKEQVKATEEVKIFIPKPKPKNKPKTEIPKQLVMPKNWSLD